MEYPRKDLSKAIYYVLSLNPNKSYNVEELNDLLLNEKACPEFTDNVVTRYQLSKALDELSKELKIMMETYDNLFFANDKITLTNESQLTNIKKIIESEKYQEIKKLDFESLEYDGDSLLHLLCKNKETELLNIVSKYHNINFLKQNVSGVTLLNILAEKEKKELVAAMNICLKQIENLDKTCINVAKQNKQLAEQNYNDQLKINRYEERIENLTMWYNRMIALTIIPFVILFVVIIEKHGFLN